MPLTKDQKIDFDRITEWFKKKSWTPWDFQITAWTSYLDGHSGLINVPTGAGKTYAAYFGPLIDLMSNPQDHLTILYVTPLRAVARDITLAMQAPLQDLKLDIRLESRTGDSSSSAKNRQRKKLPHILVTTPESLALLLSYANANEQFSNLRSVILDEWHELMSSKRGTLTELVLTRLRHISPEVRTWALSATIANLEDAAQVAVGTNTVPHIIRSKIARPIEITSLIPEKVDAFPWSGHLGLSMRDRLIKALDPNISTLIFINTRSQAERWYQELLLANPEWQEIMALHHGSLATKERETIEGGVKSGEIRIVVCTSSLDLGVDFAPVERVFQIGSPKGIARLLQRAGRAAHRPGETSRITFVPTNALELIEIAAVRTAVERNEIEGRESLSKPLDVLTQHVVTCALGGGFIADELYREVVTAVSYSKLTREEFDWVLQLVIHGGETLQAYPDYHRVELIDGRYTVTKKRIAHLHRMNIGTITADATIKLRFLRGGSIGRVEESYVARLKRGDKFVFAGRVLEFIKVQDMEAYVKPASSKTTQTPRWYGGKLPFTASLAGAMRRTIEEVAIDTSAELKSATELQAAKPIFDAQLNLSVIPTRDELLIEIFKSREGTHMFVFPFEGRGVHEGIAVLLALRLSRLQPATFSLSVNDYGLELLCAEEFPYENFMTPEIFSTEHLLNDTLAAINVSELAKRQFREIARVSGLVFQSYPGLKKGSHQIQASASLIYDVFRRFDPENLLLKQADREVLETQFEETRLAHTLQRLSTLKLLKVKVNGPTPLDFPLMIERIGARVSSETLAERIERMKNQWVKTTKK